jgi:PLD-like domain
MATLSPYPTFGKGQQCTSPGAYPTFQNCLIRLLDSPAGYARRSKRLDPPKTHFHTPYDAAKNGVSVQIMLPPLSPAAPGVSSADNNETYRILSPLVAVNVTPRYFIHAKMIIADQRLAFVGSQNLSHQSLHFSREVGILISNTSVVARLFATFHADWKDAQDRASRHRR